MRSPGDAAARSVSSQDLAVKLEVDVIENEIEAAAKRESPDANEAVGRLAGDASGGTPERNARRRRLKKEKPLSKRMARARLIPPSRRSARKTVTGASSTRPKLEKAPSSPNEEFESRADDENLKMVDKSQPPIWMRVPQVKGEGSFYKCCVWGCRAAGPEPFTGIWLFSLPADEALRSTWCENLPVDPEINRPLSPRVCFQHFDEEDFVVVRGRPRGIAEDAVPMLMRNEEF
ncbi:uncharacterized protein LOC119400865 [Rhipicephalus sanguineus]|uniref:uncharacterized protein LOC119400865 n=1 Tax=Rhipicephalus sanguineus TaxID=34632 RepID=UPI00189313E2|nr:uncharacterized protein LOC119400865 [Rhipicephalus sanguineus]